MKGKMIITEGQNHLFIKAVEFWWSHGKFETSTTSEICSKNQVNMTFFLGLEMDY